MKKNILLFSAIFASMIANAQVTTEEIRQNPLKACGNYYAYNHGNASVTPTPKGYEPFYISEYARHGSRYMTSNEPYHKLIPLMEKADSSNLLTDLGRTLLFQLKVAYAANKGKSELLSKLGERQHEMIASRMYQHYPEVFAPGNFINAYASSRQRAQESMKYQCIALKRLSPTLQITQDYSRKYYFITMPNHDSIQGTAEGDRVLEQAAAMEDSLIGLNNISARFFKDPSFVTKNKMSHLRFSKNVMFIHKSMQSLPEIGLTFDYFTEAEKWNFFKASSLNWIERCYLLEGENPYYKRMYPLLRHLISLADETIAQDKAGATLRFGHDTYVFPLAYILGFEKMQKINLPPSKWEESYKYYRVFDIVPMAANIQLVFFRNKKNHKDVLVKFLLQEEEQRIPVKTNNWPYYKWKDVKEYYLDLMYKKDPIIYKKVIKRAKAESYAMAF